MTGILSLKRGVRLGIVSTVSILLLNLWTLWLPPVSPSMVLPLEICALFGNALNIVSLIFCLRELTGEGLFTATFLILNQILWVLFAIRALTVDF
jgi:hypothetical protein